MKKILLFILGFSTCLFVNAQNDSIDIQHYDINLDINNTIQGRHIGYCDLSVKVINPNNYIIKLNLLNHNVDSVYVNGYPAPYYYYLSPNISITIPSGTQDGDILDIRIWYSGSQVTELYGWGGIHYDPRIIYSLNVAIMDPQHSFARSWFPCQDMFSDKATFNLNISSQSSRKVICGGVLDSVVSISDSSSRWHWRIPQTIAPYLVAVTIADYYLIEDSIAGIANNFPLHIYCFPEDSLILRSKVGLIKDAFHGLESKFGEFRFNRVGYSVTPLGSMEHVDNISLARSAATGQGDGNNSNIVHELGHSWFGNYMGGYCELDMWIKEGWTSWSEKISFEAHYGIEYAKNYFRNNMEAVLNKMPLDEGYRILYGVTGADVYSTTTYRKGAAVVHTLKGYLGDDVFFPSVRAMLSNYGYGVINTLQMRDFLSAETNIDLNDFFDFHVLDSGYNHYSIAEKTFNGNIATISIKQRTIANENGGCNFTRIPVTFVDQDWNKEKRIIEFTGVSTTQSINLSFNPINCFIDLEEEIADATLDNYKTIDSIGTFHFPNTYFFANILSNPDSVFLRTTLHWLGDEENSPMINGVHRISRKHYWTIEGMGLENCQIEGNFFYKLVSGSNNFDNDLISKYSSLDSLMLLYRPNHNADWIPVKTNDANNTSGYLKLNALWEGDYIMAIGDKSIIGLANLDKACEPKMKLYPNPVRDMVNLKFSDIKDDYNLIITDNMGKEFHNAKIIKGSTNIQFNINLNSGLYIISLVSKDKQTLIREKMIVIK
ncbi:MAG: M1 family aminopeptidase [Bacteroidales bacterium]